MPAVRASYSIEPAVLRRFNESVPSGERSQLIQQMMTQAIAERDRTLAALAEEFETHPDFAAARADAAAFDVTIADGLDEFP